MIRALKEYKEMALNPSLKWAKKHWKGYLVFMLIISVIEVFGIYLVYYRKDIMENIKNKFKKNEKES